MDMEHQQQLVELEQRHQEKVLNAFTLFSPFALMWPEIFHFTNFCFFPSTSSSPSQVHYFLNQLQSRAAFDEASQKDEGRAENMELEERLKVQVRFKLSHHCRHPNFSSLNVKSGSFILKMCVVLLGKQAAGAD